MNDCTLVYKKICVNPGTESYASEWVAEINIGNERFKITETTLDGLCGEMLSMNLPSPETWTRAKPSFFEDPRTFRLYILEPPNDYEMIHCALSFLFRLKSVNLRQNIS
ncbi:hypothetical protein HYT57_05810 [Candidatus Woesearchaeota archaeon]|nr:hypothetical protein [Candidatus Woesearchaeota archaeon]